MTQTVKAQDMALYRFLRRFVLDQIETEHWPVLRFGFAKPWHSSWREDPWRGKKPHELPEAMPRMSVLIKNIYYNAIPPYIIGENFL